MIIDNYRKLALALHLVIVPTAEAHADGRAVPVVRLVEATAPRELIACAKGSVPDEGEVVFDEAIEKADRHLMDEARRLRIERMGESFLSRINQVERAYPLDFDLCRSIPTRPEGATPLVILELPERPVRIGYCPSTDADQCRDALKAILAPPPAVERPQLQPASGSERSIAEPTPAAFVITRVSGWNGSRPPTTAQMVEAAFRLAPITAEIQADGPAARDPHEVRDAVPRPAGTLAGSGANNPRMEPPAQPATIGFVFAVSK